MTCDHCSIQLLFVGVFNKVHYLKEFIVLFKWFVQVYQFRTVLTTEK